MGDTKRPDSTREIISGAEELLKKRRANGKDSTADRLIAEADAKVGRKTGGGVDTRQLIVDSEKLVGRTSGKASGPAPTAEKGGGKGTLIAILLAVVVLAGLAYFFLK